MKWEWPVYNWLLNACRTAAVAANQAVIEAAKTFNTLSKDQANVARFNAAMAFVLPAVKASLAKGITGTLASMSPLASAIATAAIETAYQAYKLANTPPVVHDQPEPGNTP